MKSVLSTFVLVLSLCSIASAQQAAPSSESAPNPALAYVPNDPSQAVVPQPNANFPIGPDATMTPGALCQHPDEYRYPEHIPYCNRNVDTGTKRQVIAAYDHTFGYHIEEMDRQDFKIDHYIPLCVGGANDTTNLWPQNKSVYTITDPLEATVCDKMAAGKLLQRDAVTYIRRGKANLATVPAILNELNAL